MKWIQMGVLGVILAGGLGEGEAHADPRKPSGSLTAVCEAAARSVRCEGTCPCEVTKTLDARPPLKATAFITVEHAYLGHKGARTLFVALEGPQGWAFVGVAEAVKDVGESKMNSTFELAGVTVIDDLPKVGRVLSFEVDMTITSDNAEANARVVERRRMANVCSIVAGEPKCSQALLALHRTCAPIDPSRPVDATFSATGDLVRWARRVERKGDMLVAPIVEGKLPSSDSADVPAVLELRLGRAFGNGFNSLRLKAVAP